MAGIGLHVAGRRLRTARTRRSGPREVEAGGRLRRHRGNVPDLVGRAPNEVQFHSSQPQSGAAAVLRNEFRADGFRGRRGSLSLMAGNGKQPIAKRRLRQRTGAGTRPANLSPKGRLFGIP